MQSVLVVDDEATIRMMMRTMLEFSGFEVHEAADGLQALDQVAAHHPDIMLLDVMMPRLDGLGVCRQLRSQAETAALPIIMFSGKTQEEAVREGLAAGANRYVRKPAAPTEIVQIINEVLA